LARSVLARQQYGRRCTRLSQLR